jgi:hypothetical protein
MDFSNRDVQPPAAAQGARNTASASFSPSGKKDKHRDKGELKRIVTVALAAAVAILIGAVITLLVVANNNVRSEDKFVDTNKLQAVFLNTGQVYFGHITRLNNKYFVVTNIYYLQSSSNNASGSSSNSANSANNVTLVKLGCELHEPYDQMVINSDQVTFWENLQDNGQVAKAVSTFQKQNPGGQKCADQSSSASPTSSSSAQNAGSSSAPSTTPATKP